MLLTTLCRTRNLASAAERLGLSTPTASRMLAQLREIFSDQLFTRFPGGLVPTRKAVLLEARAAEVLERYGALMEPLAFDPARIEREIRIGCADNAPFSIFPNFADRLIAQAPGVTVSFLPLSEDRFALLSAGEIDFAVSPVMALPEGFRGLELARTDYVLTASPEHPLVALARERGPVPTEAVLAHPFADVCFHTRPEASWSSLRETVFPSWTRGRAAMRTTQFLSLVPAVTASRMLLILPRRTAEVLARGGLLSVIPTVERSIEHRPQLIWHHRANDDLELQWVRSILVDSARRASGPAEAEEAVKEASAEKARS